MEARKKGGQVGNLNALKHGRFSVAKRAERRVTSQERHRRSKEEWPDIPIGYDGIMAAIRASRDAIKGQRVSNDEKNADQ
jgi:hypothetical protein